MPVGSVSRHTLHLLHPSLSSWPSLLLGVLPVLVCYITSLNECFFLLFKVKLILVTETLLHLSWNRVVLKESIGALIIYFLAWITPDDCHSHRKCFFKKERLTCIVILSDIHHTSWALQVLTVILYRCLNGRSNSSWFTETLLHSSRNWVTKFTVTASQCTHRWLSCNRSLNHSIKINSFLPVMNCSNTCTIAIFISTVSRF